MVLFFRRRTRNYDDNDDDDDESESCENSFIPHFLTRFDFFFCFVSKNGRTWAFLQWRKTVFISSSQKFSEFSIVIIYAPGNSIFVVKCYFSSLRRNRPYTQCYQSPSQVQEKKRLRTDKHGLTKRHDIVCERKAKIPYCSYHYWNKK